MADQKGLKTISVEEATEKTLAEHSDHTALARRQLRDNFRLLNTSRVLLQEYDALRNEMETQARFSPPPVMARLRRIMEESQKRIDATVANIDAALGETEPSNPSLERKIPS